MSKSLSVIKNDLVGIFQKLTNKDFSDEDKRKIIDEELEPLVTVEEHFWEVVKEDSALRSEIEGLAKVYRKNINNELIEKCWDKIQKL